MYVNKNTKSIIALLQLITLHSIDRYKTMLSVTYTLFSNLVTQIVNKI